MRTTFSRTPGAEPPLLISCVTAGHMLGVAPGAVWRLCKSGELPSGHIGGQIVIPPAAVRAYARKVVEDAA